MQEGREVYPLCGSLSNVFFVFYFNLTISGQVGKVLQVLFRTFDDAFAQMAELVDALALGASGVTLVRVRVSLWAPRVMNPNG